MSDDVEGLPPMSRLEETIEAHRAAFGRAPGLFRVRGKGRDDELADRIESAVLAGQPVDEEAIERDFGVGRLPPYASA